MKPHKRPEIKNSFEDQIILFGPLFQKYGLFGLLGSAVCYGLLRDDILSQTFCHATVWNRLVVQPALEDRQAQNAENPSIKLQHAIMINKLVTKLMNYISLNYKS